MALYEHVFLARQDLSQQQVDELVERFKGVITEGGVNTEARLPHAFRIVLARTPEPDEAARVRAVLDHFLTKYRADAEAAKAVIANGESKPDAKLDAAELAAWTQIGNLLLNLDENVSIN